MHEAGKSIIEKAKKFFSRAETYFGKAKDDSGKAERHSLKAETVLAKVHKWLYGSPLTEDMVPMNRVLIYTYRNIGETGDIRYNRDIPPKALPA